MDSKNTVAGTGKRPAKSARVAGKKKRKGRKDNRRHRWTGLKYSLLFLVSAFLLILLFLFSVHAGLWGRLPDYNELKSIRNAQASILYSADGAVLGKYYTVNRTDVNFRHISPHAVKALIATEDVRFYQHEGVDRVSMLRVLFKTFLLGDRSSGGGSTISQQLAKNLYPREEQSCNLLLIHKIKEMFTARRLENIYTKDEILTLYLNTVYFGDNCYGIESASQKYFSTSASRLTLPQAATLIGMLKGPSYYNPRLHPARAARRRNTVLAQMVKYGYLSKPEGEKMKSAPLTLDYSPTSHYSGPAPYLRERIRQDVMQILDGYNRENGTGYNLYRDGLTITATLDARLQTYAEQAVKEHMEALQKSFYAHWGDRQPWSADPSILDDAVKGSAVYKALKAEGLDGKQIRQKMKEKKSMLVYHPSAGEKKVEFSSMDSIAYYLKILHPALLSVDPRNGEIKAWVGGLDYKYFQYDQVKAARQAGSVFKPVVYSAAVNHGARTDAYYSNGRRTYYGFDAWSPRNADNDYEGYYTLKGALSRSINTIAVEVLMQTGIETVIGHAHHLGIREELPPYPSLALGTANIPLDQMISPYLCLAADGILHTPYYLKEIKGPKGEIIYRAPAAKGKRVMPAEKAAVMNDMLVAAVEEGTGKRLKTVFGLDCEIAGKTGTTQNQADGWFIGYTPRLVTGIRVGANNAGIHFNTISLGQGANMALPIFGLYTRKYLADRHFSAGRNLTFPPVPLEMRQEELPPYKEKLKFRERLLNDKIDAQERRKAEEMSGKVRKEGFFRRLFGRKGKKSRD